MVDKAAVFIDGGYFDVILIEKFDWARINYERLSNLLCGEYERWSTFYYHCTPWQDDPPTDEQRRKLSQMQKFLTALKRSPRFEIRLGKLVMRSDGPHQKGVDIQIAIDMVKLAASDRIDKAILISGDSDLVPAVRAVQDLNVLVELVYHPDAIGNELFETARDRRAIDPALIDACRN